MYTNFLICVIIFVILLSFFTKSTVAYSNIRFYKRTAMVHEPSLFGSFICDRRGRTELIYNSTHSWIHFR